MPSSFARVIHQSITDQYLVAQADDFDPAVTVPLHHNAHNWIGEIDQPGIRQSCSISFTIAITGPMCERHGKATGAAFSAYGCAPHSAKGFHSPCARAPRGGTSMESTTKDAPLNASTGLVCRRVASLSPFTFRRCANCPTAASFSTSRSTRAS